MPKKHDIIEVQGQLFHQTDDGYLFSDGSKNKEGELIKVWLPISLCEWEETKAAAQGASGTMQMPEWLALEKGLI